MLSKLDVDVSRIHARNGRNAIVMYSGGMDSTVSLWWAMNRYEKVKVLILDYNQPHKEEIETAKRIIRLTGIEHKSIKIGLPDDFWGLENFLTRGQAGFTASIAALDIGYEGADIVLGILRTDPYRDCDRDYLDSVAHVLYNEKDTGDIGIATPLHAVKDKKAVVAMGYELGVPMLHTWSCRHPRGGVPCAECFSCRERTSALEGACEEYGIDAEEFLAWQGVLGSPNHPSFQNVPDELRVLAAAFLEAGGIKRGTPGWRYFAPDGKDRMASLIHNCDTTLIKNANAGKICNNISVRGVLSDDSLWEVCVCKDGSVAATDVLPEFSIIEKELIKSVEI